MVGIFSRFLISGSESLLFVVCVFFLLLLIGVLSDCENNSDFCLCFVSYFLSKKTSFFSFLLYNGLSMVGFLLFFPIKKVILQLVFNKEELLLISSFIIIL